MKLGSRDDAIAKTNANFNKTLDQMVEVANNFYGMSVDEKKQFRFIISTQFSNFINECENKDTGEE